MPAQQVTPAIRKCRRFRFSLRTLLGLVAIISMCLGLYARQVYVQKQAVTALESKGALVYYGKTVPWLFGFIDRDLFGTPTAVSFYQTNVDDADLRLLKDLQHLRIVNLGATRVTDGGLAHLADLPNLELLVCEPSQFSEAEFEKLRELGLDCIIVDGPLEGWLLSTPDMRHMTAPDPQSTR